MGKVIYLPRPEVADENSAEAVLHYMNKVRDRLLKGVAVCE